MADIPQSHLRADGTHIQVGPCRMPGLPQPILTREGGTERFSLVKRLHSDVAGIIDGMKQ